MALVFVWSKVLNMERPQQMLVKWMEGWMEENTCPITKRKLLCSGQVTARWVLHWGGSS